MSDPSETENQAAEAAARGDLTRLPRKSGHALQRSGCQKADEQTMRDVAHPPGRAVRRRPGQATRGL